MQEEINQIGSAKKAGKLQKVCKLSLSRIDHLLNGYGRIIEYTGVESGDYSVTEPLATMLRGNKRLSSVSEGHFRSGRLNGYGRIFDVDTNEVYATVGFFTDGFLNGQGEKFQLGDDL